MKEKYKQDYYYSSIRRCLLKTLVVFVFQYLIIMRLSFSYPALPWYPPMGLAFVWFYVLGGDAVWGLLLASLCGYFFQGFSIESIFLYCLADIACGYWGASICKNSFSSDIRIFKELKEWWNFFIKNAGLVCVVSASLRWFAFLLSQPTSVSPVILFYHYIDLWFADVNAILVLSAFLFCWVTIPFSREKMRAELLLTLALFALSTCYLAYWGAYKMDWVHSIGIAYYTFVPGGLLLVIGLVIGISYRFDRSRISIGKR